MYDQLRKTALASVAALSLSAIALASPASAFGGPHWHAHGGGWGGAAVGVGLAAGAIAGAALASPYYGYNGCDPYYGCSYGPGYGTTVYYNDFGPQYPLAPNYPYYSTGGNSGGANFPP